MEVSRKAKGRNHKITNVGVELGETALAKCPVAHDRSESSMMAQGFVTPTPPGVSASRTPS